MSIVMSTPGVDGLREVVRVLRRWQDDRAAMQVHPGDLGWHWRFGAETAARAVRTWDRDGETLAVGLIDSPGLLRVGIAPGADQDDELARRMASDVAQLLPRGSGSVEARCDGPFRTLLLDDGWHLDEPWTPLRWDLTEPVAPCGVRIEAIGPERAHVRVAVQRAAFDGSTFTDERWHAMAGGSPYADARCLVAHDDHGAAVAAATVWSAGPGRPGLLEPVGVHRDHRGRGHGRAIAVAAAAALRAMGSSSATVVTPSSNVGAVATYRSAGFRRHPDVHDLRRSAPPGPGTADPVPGCAR